ncbi:MAG: peptidylprolyl isomerase [Bacteroidales bacterium]|nr:peptidylprolyl isomerase [Bacteroidales bacterium]
MKGFLASVMAVVVFAICGCGNNTNTEDTVSNLYNDATLRQISDLRASRRGVDLVKYCTSQYPSYRAAGAMALAALHDSMAIYTLAPMTGDQDNVVRTAALFAMGEIGHPEAEDYILKNGIDMQPDDVKAAAIVALGKCGGAKSLKYIEELSISHSNAILVSAQCRAMCWMASRGMYSIQTHQKAIEYICDTTIHESARAIAAEYFGICDAELSLYTDEFARALGSATLINNKTNLILALGKCNNQRSRQILKGFLDTPGTDIRIIRNVTDALQNFQYKDCKETMLSLLNSDNGMIAIQSADYLLQHGIAADSTLYWNLSQSKLDWKPRTRLLAAALKFSNNKQPISDGIMSGFDITPNPYEKAALLSALKYDLNCISFVENNTFYHSLPAVRTEGVRTLVAMYESPEFKDFAARKLKNEEHNVEKDFAVMFKNIITNGNSQMVAIAADFLTRHSELNEYLSNTFFINQAINKCQLPRDIETHKLLVDALKSVAGVDMSHECNYSDTISWSYVSQIKPDAEVEVSTSKGKFVIRTDVNNAPVAVSKFLKLAEQKYFDNTCLYGNITNRISNRGSESLFDENQSVMMPSELQNTDLEEGSVILSTSKLRESYATQWEIMLYPSAIMDGTATVVGKVVSGMDVVLSLNTGDVVNSISVKK